MSSSSHNPEKRVWKGRSYRKGGERISELKIKAFKEEDLPEPSEGVKELVKCVLINAGIENTGP